MLRGARGHRSGSHQSPSNSSTWRASLRSSISAETDTPASLPQRELPGLHLREALPDPPGRADLFCQIPTASCPWRTVYLYVCLPLGCTQALLCAQHCAWYTEGPQSMLIKGSEAGMDRTKSKHPEAPKQSPGKRGYLLSGRNTAEAAVRTLGHHMQDKRYAATCPRFHVQGLLATPCSSHQDISRDAQKEHILSLLKSLQFEDAAKRKEGVSRPQSPQPAGRKAP